MIVNTMFRACEGKYAVTQFAKASQRLVVGIHPRKDASTRKNGNNERIKKNETCPPRFVQSSELRRFHTFRTRFKPGPQTRFNPPVKRALKSQWNANCRPLADLSTEPCTDFEE